MHLNFKKLTKTPHYLLEKTELTAILKSDHKQFSLFGVNLLILLER